MSSKLSWNRDRGTGYTKGRGVKVLMEGKDELLDKVLLSARR